MSKKASFHARALPLGSGDSTLSRRSGNLAGRSQPPEPFGPRVGASVASQRCRMLRSGNRNSEPEHWSLQRICTQELTQALAAFPEAPQHVSSH
jgi:hypothetical protein